MRVNFVFWGGSAFKKNYCRRYQYFYAAVKRCVKKLDVFFGWIWFATASYSAYSQILCSFRPDHYIRGGWSVITSCNFRYKLWSWSCAFWSSAKAQELSCKEGPHAENGKILTCQRLQKIFVALINRDNPENVWNSDFMNEVSYVDNQQSLKAKYVRNHASPFVEDELNTMKRLRRKSEKAYRKNANFQAKSRFLNSVLKYIELFTKKNVSLVKISVLSIVRCSTSWEKNAVLPQSLGEPECLARKLNAFFVKKIEAVLFSLHLTNGLELNDSHTITLEIFQFLLLSALQLLLGKISNNTAPNDVKPMRLCKNCFDKLSRLLHCFNQFHSPHRILSQSIQTRTRETAHKEV